MAAAVSVAMEGGITDADYEAIKHKLCDWEWRINNLYTITDKDGNVIPFKLNRSQRRFFAKMWYRNIILKARQLGFTTFMLIFMLDVCLFGDNKRCGLIAHTRLDAQRLFREKLKFAYEKLPEWLRGLTQARNDSAGELVFANGSSISVSTSYRGGTLNYLHISEFGKICRMYPEKAREIVTGAFESVGKNCVITIESTAEGRDGYFFDFCQTAEGAALQNLQLTQLDFKFFFYPWFEDPDEYAISQEQARDVVIPPRMIDYFVELRKKEGIKLSKEQMIWYALKERTLGDDMKREYPSTSAEAFWQSTLGAYYRTQFNLIFKQKRITKVPHTPGLLVHTIWDLGVNDRNAIWFVQRTGREWAIIDYYENSDVGVDHYAGVLQDRAKELGYQYGVHIGPHDLKVREWGNDAKTRLQSALDKGIKFHLAPDGHEISLKDGIEAVRGILGTCVFDEERTEPGYSQLMIYRKVWDENAGTWKDKPHHGPESNAADSFRYFAISVDIILDLITTTSNFVPQQKAPSAGHYA